MIDTLLRAFGLRTGRFTSPHLESMTERISLDGEPIDRRAVRRDVRRRRAVPRPGRRPAATHPLSFFEVLTGDGVRRLRRRPGRRRRRRGRHGRHLGRHQRRRRAGRGGHARSRVDHARYLGDTLERDRRREGRDHQAGRRTACSPSSRSRPPRCCCAGRSRSARTVAREGIEFGVARARGRRRRPAARRCAGLGGEYDEVFLPLLRRPPGAERRRRAGRGRGVPRRRRTPSAAARRRPGPRGVRRGHLARAGSRSSAAARRSCSTPRTTRTARGRRPRRSSESFGFTPLVGVVGVMADKDVRGHARGVRAGARRGRRHPELRHRAMPADELAAVAVEVFGEDRVEVAPRLDDAIDAAITLAEEEGDLGGRAACWSPARRHRRRGPHRCSVRELRACSDEGALRSQRPRSSRRCVICLRHAGGAGPRPTSIGRRCGRSAASGCRAVRRRCAGLLRPAGRLPVGLGAAGRRWSPAGFVVPVMFFLGLLFAALWFARARTSAARSTRPEGRQPRGRLGAPSRTGTTDSRCQTVTERTLVLVKPDAVRRGLVGRGPRPDRAQGPGRSSRWSCARIDGEHRRPALRRARRASPSTRRCVDFITSGPLVALVARGRRGDRGRPRADRRHRPGAAAPGTIRGDLSLSNRENLVHGSDSAESAAREIKIFFPDL